MISLFYKSNLNKLLAIFFAINISLLISKIIVKYIELTQLEQKCNNSAKSKAKK